MGTTFPSTKAYVVASDFDQTLSSNDSGRVLSENNPDWGHVLTSNSLFKRLTFLAKLLSLCNRLAKRRMAMVTAGYCMPPAN
jgi:hypothetical protein